MRIVSACVRITLCIVAGLIGATLCAIIGWFVVDNFVPLTSDITPGLFTRLWSQSPTFGAFIERVDNCSLSTVFLYRAEVLLGLSVALLGYRIARQVYQFGSGVRPSPSVILMNFALLILTAISLTAIPALRNFGVDQHAIEQCQSRLFDPF